MYLFIARKEESVDYCRGCRMASYSGDFFFENWLSREELIKKWGEYLHKNLNLRCNESSYEFFIFKDGIQVYGEYGSCWDGDKRNGYADTEEHAAQQQSDMEEITSIRTEASAVANELQRLQEKKKMQEATDTAQREADKARQERQAQFEKLKQEFGN